MKTVEIRGLVLGKGKPKVCIPVVGKTQENILKEVKYLNTLDNDLLELRIDHYENVEEEEKVLSLLSQVREVYEKPILFTFRTKKEGGVHEMSDEKYFQINKLAIESRYIDIIDVELFIQEKISRKLIDLAHDNDVKVIMSNHDFDKTVSKDEIIDRLKKMQDMKADITKIAQMPKKEEDVLELLSATLEIKNRYGDRPCITMSMGALGKISRVAGELVGSALTFGAAHESSAPGQVNVNDLNHILEVLKLE